MFQISNNILQKDIFDALHWDPCLYTADIDVIVQEGVVTITGLVDNYGQKEAALAAVKNVAGVSAVTENLKVKIDTWADPPDADVHAQIVNVFKWHWNIPKDIITIKVENGWVTLGGAVQWHYQKEAAEKTVSMLMGVKGVSNTIKIVPQAGIKPHRTAIEAALNRIACKCKDTVHVEIAGTRVIITGSVGSWHQREEVSKMVWCAPGVSNVDNQLVIDVKNDNF